MNESSEVCHGAAQAKPSHPGWKTELPAHSIRNSFRLTNEVVTSTPDVELAARGSVAVHSKSNNCKKARVCAAGVPTKSLRSIECVERAGCKAESGLRATNCWSIKTGGWSAVWGPEQLKQQIMIHQPFKSANSRSSSEQVSFQICLGNCQPLRKPPSQNSKLLSAEKTEIVCDAQSSLNWRRTINILDLQRRCRI